jgi:hypothetical protein
MNSGCTFKGKLFKKGSGEINKTINLDTSFLTLLRFECFVYETDVNKGHGLFIILNSHISGFFNSFNPLVWSKSVVAIPSLY